MQKLISCHIHQLYDNGVVYFIVYGIGQPDVFIFQELNIKVKTLFTHYSLLSDEAGIRLRLEW